MKETELDHLRKLAEDVCVRENCRLYDLEFITGSRGKGRVLRVYIDKESGAGIEDCTNVSRALSLLLDVEDVVEGGEYSLEVSTPGLDRILRQKWHFESAVGNRIELKTKNSMDQFNEPHPALKNRMRLTGQLEEAGSEAIVVGLDGLRIKVPYEEIEKARRVFVVEPSGLKPKDKRKK